LYGPLRRLQMFQIKEGITPSNAFLFDELKERFSLMLDVGAKLDSWHRLYNAF
jgi:hypothetical protein